MELEFLRDSLANEWGDGNNYALRSRIEKHIIAARATIIQRRYDNTKIFPETLLITLTIKDLVKEDPCSCDCSSLLKLFKKTPFQLPKPLIVKDESYFNYVGSKSFENGFGWIPSHDLDSLVRRRFTSNQVFYTLINDYIFIIGQAESKGITSITVKYLPENPIELLKLGSCSGSCFKAGKFYIEETFIEGILSLMQNRRPQIMKNVEEEININE